MSPSGSLAVKVYTFVVFFRTTNWSGRFAVGGLFGAGPETA
jgi:hypothetical protein